MINHIIYKSDNTIKKLKFTTLNICKSRLNIIKFHCLIILHVYNFVGRNDGQLTV